MSYLRIATHPGIFSAPLTPAEALRNVDALVALPQVRLLAEEDGLLEVYREVTGSFPVRGNLVPDAHLAALPSTSATPSPVSRETNGPQGTRVPFALWPSARNVLTRSPSPQTVMPEKRLYQVPSGTSGSLSSQRASSSS
jgi:hypothetical protein